MNATLGGFGVIVNNELQPLFFNTTEEAKSWIGHLIPKRGFSETVSFKIVMVVGSISTGDNK